MRLLATAFSREALTLHAPGAVQKCSSSKAAAMVVRGTYLLYVSTEKGRERRWRLFSTAPI